MNRKINFRELKERSLAQDLMLATCANYKEFEEGLRSGKIDTRNIDVKLTIEGIEIDFLEYMELLQKDYMGRINKRAKEMMSEVEGIYELQSILMETQERLQELGKTKFKYDWE